MSKSMLVGGFAGAIVIVLAWSVKTFAQIDIPAEVAAAVGVIIQGLAHEYFPEPA